LKQEILIKLKSAEAENDERLSKAKEEAARRVQEARRQATDLVRSAEQSARKAAESTIKSTQARLESERTKILAAGAKNEDALRKRYKAGVDAAVKKAVETFEGTLDA
jgi:ATP synthase H subunit